MLAGYFTHPPHQCDHCAHPFWPAISQISRASAITASVYQNPDPRLTHFSGLQHGLSELDASAVFEGEFEARLSREASPGLRAHLALDVVGAKQRLLQLHLVGRDARVTS